MNSWLFILCVCVWAWYKHACVEKEVENELHLYNLYPFVIIYKSNVNIIINNKRVKQYHKHLKQKEDYDKRQ